jgi:hypothetical protein
MTSTEQTHRFARCHGYQAHFTSIAHGDFAALGAATETTFTASGHELRLRLLDKRLDILTYLRFADVTTRSCFRSTSHFYRDDHFMTINALIDVWKDPLSFCFHIERRVGDAYVAVGFCFGGFIEIDGALGIALNSLHVRPGTADVRARVLRLIEELFCQPLGIEIIGIACTHNGRGPLPADYKPRRTRLRRLRALVNNGEVVTTAFDDISAEVNESIDVDGLFWRTR